MSRAAIRLVAGPETTHLGHAADVEVPPPFDDHIARTPKVGHFVFEYAPRKGKDPLYDLQQRIGEGLQPRSEDENERRSGRGAELDEVSQPGDQP